MKLDHLTAIVGDREGAAAALARLLGVEPARVDLPGMAIATFAVAGVELHVNAPTGPGPVSDALATRGVHLHHVAFATEDLEREIQRVELLGFRVRGAPIETAPGLREVFLDPATTAGVLVQLVERTEAVDAASLRGDPIAALARSALPTDDPTTPGE